MALSVVRRERRRHWTLVAVVTAILLALPAALAAVPGSGATVDPARLRQLVLASDSRSYQGYAEVTGALGVPELPNLSDVSALLSGTTRVRTWYRSPDRWRFDVLGTATERDFYRTPVGEYVWDYSANLLTAFIGEPPVRLPRAGDLLPPDLARRVLTSATADPVEPLPSRRLAGVDAAGLRVRPADPATTIGAVDIWADPVSGLPLRVELTARGATQPVLRSAFDELDQRDPDPAVLTPRPAPGSGVTAAAAPDVGKALGALGQVRLPFRLAGREQQISDLAGIRGAAVYGTGLSAFIALALPRDFGSSATEAAGKAGGVTTALTAGSAVSVSVPPLSLLVAQSTLSRRWYLLAGLVDPALLRQAADELSTIPRRSR